MAIIWATKYFRPYLFGRRFKIITDHKPLQWLFSLKEPNSKLVRWRLKLEEFDYEIQYKKGSLNKNADALSRIEINVNETQEAPIFQYMREFNEKMASTSKPQEEDNQSMMVQLDDEEIRQNNSDDVTVHSNHEDPIIGIPIIDSPVNIGNNQIIVTEVNYDPVTPEVIKLFNSKQRFLVQISKNNFENDVIKFLKE